MNDRQLEKKVQQDASEIRKDLDTMMDDGASQFSKGFEKLKGEAKDTLVGAADTVKKEVGQGLSQYNAKAQEFVDKVPGDLGKKAVQYPWVTISVGVVAGLLLGALLKPSRK